MSRREGCGSEGLDVSLSPKLTEERNNLDNAPETNPVQAVTAAKPDTCVYNLTTIRAIRRIGGLGIRLFFLTSFVINRSARYGKISRP